MLYVIRMKGGASRGEGRLQSGIRELLESRRRKKEVRERGVAKVKEKKGSS